MLGGWGGVYCAICGAIGCVNELGITCTAGTACDGWLRRMTACAEGAAERRDCDGDCDGRCATGATGPTGAALCGGRDEW